MKILYSTTFKISLSHFDLTFDCGEKSEGFINHYFIYISLGWTHDLHHFHGRIAFTRALLAVSTALVGLIDVLAGRFRQDRCHSFCKEVE
jgi:hypothetical protein